MTDMAICILTDTRMVILGPILPIVADELINFGHFFRQNQAWVAKLAISEEKYSYLGVETSVNRCNILKYPAGTAVYKLLFDTLPKQAGGAAIDLFHMHCQCRVFPHISHSYKYRGLSRNVDIALGVDSQRERDGGTRMNRYSILVYFCYPRTCSLGTVFNGTVFEQWVLFAILR